MNQVKIGDFMKELRKEKGLTQEQTAEQFMVNRRTVSRWETGNNLPDLDILIEMADYYEVSVRELLDGERVQAETVQDAEETVLKLAEYSNEDKLKVPKRMRLLFIVGILASVLYLLLLFIDYTNDFIDFLSGMCLGIQFGMMIVGAIMTSRYASKLRAYKMRLLQREGRTQ